MNTVPTTKKRRGQREIPAGLDITILHPESMADGWARSSPNAYQPRDGDGHHIQLDMDRMRGESLAYFRLRRGMTKEAAVGLLKKAIDIIERGGDKLLNLPCSESAWMEYDPLHPEGVVCFGDSDGNPIGEEPKESEADRGH